MAESRANRYQRICTSMNAIYFECFLEQFFYQCSNFACLSYRQYIEEKWVVY